MIWRIVKFILRIGTVEARLTGGDQLWIKVTIAGNTVLDRTVDIIPD